MTLDALIMLAGFFVAVLPFLGFPIQWDNIILVAMGIIVIMLGIFVRRRGLRSPMKASPTQFPESVPPAAEMHDAQ